MRLQNKTFMAMLLAVMCMGEMGGAIHGTSIGSLMNGIPYEGNEHNQKNRIYKAGFYDPRSIFSGLGFRQYQGQGQYFNFDRETAILDIDGDKIDLSRHITTLYNILFQVHQNGQQQNPYAGTYPFVIESAKINKIYIIDLQYTALEASFANKEFGGYYFVLGISENHAMAAEIYNKVLQVSRGQLSPQQLITEIPIINPYVNNQYHIQNANGQLTIEINTGYLDRALGGEQITLDAADIQGLYNLVLRSAAFANSTIDPYNQLRALPSTYSKSNHPYYRLTFHFDGAAFFVLPVYKASN